MEFIHNYVTNNALMISSIILVLAYILIAWEKISKVTIALLGASLTILLGLLAQENFADALNPHYFIQYVDFQVIFLLVSMMIVVHISAASGVYNWMAIKLLKMTKGHPILVFITLGIFTAVASAFLDNVTTVILVMPITFTIAKQLDINPIPLLIAEVMCSNIGGTATLIGDPPNIIIGSKAGFSFMDFVNELSGIVVIIMIVTLAILVFWFRKQLKTTKEKMEQVANLDADSAIVDKSLMIRSMIVLGLVILGFITHDMTHLKPYLIAMLGASILLIWEKPEKILPTVEWNTIFFFIGLFTIIGGFEVAGGINIIAQWVLDVTQGSEAATAMLILWASGIISGIIDNIPYTATMAPLIYQIQQVQGVEYAHPLWWCLSLGACLGGNMTIIGAAANVIVVETANKEGYKISFMQFLKYGVTIVLISLILSSAYIYFRFLIHA